ncbi:MAG: hypothetical protein J5I28_06600 [Acidimicrobiales bacterium]|nr:hypothetical protein [Acidimicrobiales bacterium]
MSATTFSSVGMRVTITAGIAGVVVVGGFVVVGAAVVVVLCPVAVVVGAGVVVLATGVVVEVVGTEEVVVHDVVGTTAVGGTVVVCGGPPTAHAVSSDTSTTPEPTMRMLSTRHLLTHPPCVVDGLRGRVLWPEARAEGLALEPGRQADRNADQRHRGRPAFTSVAGLATVHP